MKALYRTLKVAGGLVGAVLIVLALVFGFVQTGPGKAWLAARLSASLSSPGAAVSISGISGFVPFDWRVSRIQLFDAQGPRLTIADAALAIAPADLLRGRLTLRHLDVAEIRVERSSPSSGGDMSSLLHPPLDIALAHLQVDRLELGPALLGERVVMALSASGALGGGRADADIDLKRIDGTPGQATLHVAFGGTPAALDITGAMAEPTGRLLAERLGRNGPLPVTIDVSGHGALTDWHGQLSAKAGDAAAARAEIDIKGNAPYRLALHGSASIGALLPPQWRDLAGAKIDLNADGAIDEKTVTIEAADIASAAARLALSGRFERDRDAVTGRGTLHASDLSVLTALAGIKLGGAAQAELTLSGSPKSATAHVVIEGDHLALMSQHVAQTQAVIDLGAAGDPLSPTTPIDVTGSGAIMGAVPGSGPLPGNLGQHLDWHLAAHLDRHTGEATLSELTLRDGDVTLTGHAEATPHGMTGDLHLDIADVSRFAASAHGAFALDSHLHAEPDGAATATLSGTLRDPASSIAPIDALLGRQLTLTAALDRRIDGGLSAHDVAVKGANINLSASAERAPDGVLAAHYRLELPHLDAIGSGYGGRAAITGDVGGAADRLSASLKLAADGLAASAMRLDHLDATLDVADLAKPHGDFAVAFRRRTIDGTASAAFALASGEQLSLQRLNLQAAGTRLDGALTVRLASRTVEGNLRAASPDLKPWSEILGTPVFGRAELKAALAAKAGQTIDLSLAASDFGAGAASAHRLTVTAKLADPLGKPRGQADALLEDARHGTASVERLHVHGQADRAGIVAITGEARGKAFDKFQLALGATASLERNRATLRVARLSGNIGNQPFALRKPLLVRRNDSETAFADLALSLGKGEITGEGAMKASDISLRLLGHDLPVGSMAEIAGQNGVTGLLGFDLSLRGTRTRPQGDFTIDGEELHFAAATRPDLPSFGIVANAEWRGDEVRMKGRLAAQQGAALGFTGTIPLVLDRASLAPHLPADGRLALHLEGDGELAEFSDLLPIGEDRVAGRFNIDVSVAGTVASPSADGRLSLRDGRYESLAAGTTLTGVAFDLIGDRDRLVLQNFTAGDGAKGRLTMAGSVELAAARGPAFDLRGDIQSFRAVQRDDATATASGEAQLTGDLAEPRLTARLRIDSAELRVPESLPQSAQPISVTVIDSATGKTLGTVNEQTSNSALVALALDVTVELPGKVFVRGRGLDSEWRGHLAIAGTTAAPRLTGRLEVVRGTYDFIGKSAKLTRGTITFLGGAHIDPQISMEAQINSNDIVALVRISGTAMQPTIALSSQPELPQDEILARVLFGTSIGQISAAQGFEIAQAAAALATGGGPGVLDRIRSGLGLDRLSLGSATNQSLPGLGPGLGVPALSTTPGIPGSTAGTGLGTTALAPGSSTTGTTGGIAGSAVSAGKYVANGVYVGVTQGATAGSSSADVQIDVTRHITLDATAGSTGTGTGIGTGIGLSWKLDY